MLCNRISMVLVILERRRYERQVREGGRYPVVPETKTQEPETTARE